MEPYAAHMPHINSKDLAIFPEMSKRHISFSGEGWIVCFEGGGGDMVSVEGGVGAIPKLQNSKKLYFGLPEGGAARRKQHVSWRVRWFAQSCR